MQDRREAGGKRIIILKEIDSIWFGSDESKQQIAIDYENLPDTKGTLSMVTDATFVPYAYVKDGRIVGYDVDIAARFCEANGYRLEITNMSFDSILGAIQTAKCDFALITKRTARPCLPSKPEDRLQGS